MHLCTLDPEDHESLNGWGEVLYKQGKFSEAVAKLRKATELWPDEAAYFANLGNALNASGLNEEARQAYENGLHEAAPGEETGHAIIRALESMDRPHPLIDQLPQESSGDDHLLIQGLWKLRSRIHGGRALFDPVTHYVFVGDKHREIVPDLVETGKLRTTFRLLEGSTPKKIEMKLDYNGPDGPPDPNPIVLRALYRLDGNTLEICFGVGGGFPGSFSDEHGLVTLERDSGPVPEMRQASGRPAIEDNVLGSLVWEDNFDWYAGEVVFGSSTVIVSLPDADGALARARIVVQQQDRYLRLAATSASDNLLDVKNQSWLANGERPLTSDEFIARMTLESMVFASNGQVTFYYGDGGLFLGHTIEVRIDANDQCVGADIPG